MPDTQRAETPWSKGNLTRVGGAPRILFGHSYEDATIEVEEFGEPGKVCVIAAAGETAAICAAAGHEVTAVDINAIQLDYARARLAGAPARKGMAEHGMNAARTALSAVVPGWRRSQLRPALAQCDSEQALDFWETKLNAGPFRGLLTAVLRPTSLVVRTMQPEFARFLPRQFDQIILDRLEAGLARHGMADNRFAWRLLGGLEHPGWQLPRTGADQITWAQADVLELLESVPAAHYSGISLSNVLDGASFAYGRRLRQAAARAVRPGGAVVLRSFAPPSSPGPGRALDDAAMLWGSVEVRRA